MYAHCLHIHIITQLVDYGRLYRLIGDAIVEFIKRKPQPFHHALLSKERFWSSPKWKRAMVFVFLMRHVLKFPSQKMWKRFREKDYKLNYRSFSRFMTKDEAIMKRSSKFRQIRDNENRDGKKKGQVKRKVSYSSMSSDTPTKRRCVLDVDTTDDDEE